MIFPEVLQRTFAGDGLDAAHARRHAAFFQNLDQPDLAGGAGVRAAAQFGREIADLDHAHLVAIFLAEQRHGVYSLMATSIGTFSMTSIFWLRRTSLLIMSSMSCSSSSATAVKCEKSKRR